MDDAAFIVFIGFGIVWTLLGAVAVMALFKADGQEIRLGKWGLLVAVPTILPILIAFIFGAIYLPR